ncbi:MAG: hypothetical protein BWY37_01487 [Firmicutes bacterium ADurb.Bin262]|nr:MAG: hypothetical protein BWY37_01487 [Firmicutes bacterium ADurb.Bin262]
MPDVLVNRAVAVQKKRFMKTQFLIGFFIIVRNTDINEICVADERADGENAGFEHILFERKDLPGR